jgi:hypothetical protein
MHFICPVIQFIVLATIGAALDGPASFRGDSLERRLNQLLGLPAYYGWLFFLVLVHGMTHWGNGFSVWSR